MINQDSINIKLQLVEIVINELKAEGCIDETGIRNFKIRTHFKLLTEELKYHPGEAKDILKEKYFLSDKAIEGIIYKKQKCGNNYLKQTT